jgi:hypothetical protein
MGIVTVLTEGSEGFDGWTVVVEVVAPVETMTRRKVAILCVVGLALAAGVVLTLRNPSFWVRDGMTYDEVEAVLGKQIHGLQPRSVEDGSWSGHWRGPYGMTTVTFDSQDGVREAPNVARRVLRWFGL